MIWRLLCAVPVFLSVILTLGCNSSEKQVQPLGFVSDPELMATVQALPEQLLVQGRPTIPPHHPPTILLPESNIDFKTLAVTPNPGIDYKIASVTPEPGTDYKMLIVPNQGQLRHAIGELEFSLRPKLDMPPVPWKPKKPATEQLLVQGRPTIPPHHPPTILLPESNIDFKTLAVTPNPGIDYKIASVTPDPGTDYKMLIVPNQGQLRHAIGELEFPLRPKLDMPPVPWKPKNPQRSNTK